MQVVFKDIKELKDEVKTIGNQVTKIENEHGESLIVGWICRYIKDSSKICKGK